MAKIDELFRIMVEKGASDLHLSAGAPPLLRLHGDMVAIDGQPTYDNAQIQELVFEIVSEKQKRSFVENWELDCSYHIPNLSRFRVNVFMQRRGMAAVFRVIPTEILSAEKLGLPKCVTDLVTVDRGLILVTGPTGSGKSTTLAAMIDSINRHEQAHILTIEDPIEFVHENQKSLISQREVGSHTKSFAKALKAALREDPDIILVGEIRDKETIDIAMKAALTGHLVLSTLHTNDTAATIQRILNMGVEPYLISSAVNLIVAQRLVRKICTECKEPAMIDPHVLERFGLLAESLKDSSVYKGKGCPACGGTGYSGRMPLYEVMPMTDKLKEAVLQGASTSEIRAISRREGMTTLREAGVYLVKNGITTLEEVLAKTNEDSEMEPEPQVEAQQ
ncbi:MAG: PilT/PilU family type 4a pilus ATPase, partial [Bdellovibrionales bacterium]|nr:PilT/PilU family type 4a pilus ATPase [Bdellovibrionales bacterium]